MKTTAQKKTLPTNERTNEDVNEWAEWEKKSSNTIENNKTHN